MPNQNTNIIDSYFESDIKPYTLSQFIKSGTDLTKKIPDYQRPYSWSENHILAFLMDVYKISKEDDGKGWFIGTIFMVRDSENTSQANLLDGQQRITSFFLICRVLMTIKHEDIFDSLESSFPDIHTKLEDIHDSIKETIYNDESLRFIPEENSIKLIEKFLLPKAIRKKLKYKEWKEDFDAYEAENGISATFLRLKHNISIIEQFITDLCTKRFDNDDFTSDSINIEVGAQNLIDFSNALLKKIFLIQVPLKHSDHSIEFFEALNNRGKNLSLVDRLQFKSLTWSRTQPNFNSDDLNTKWKKLFKEIEDCKYYNEHEDFYIDLFVSLKHSEFTAKSNIGKTREDSYVEFFETQFLDRDILDDFFIKSTYILKFINDITDARNSSTRDWINSGTYTAMGISQDKKNRATALLIIMNEVLKSSKASRHLLIHLLYENNPKTQMVTVLSGIWNIIKITISNDFIFGYIPRDVRRKTNKINELIKSADTELRHDKYQWNNIYTRLQENDGYYPLENPPEESSDQDLNTEQELDDAESEDTSSQLLIDKFDSETIPKEFVNSGVEYLATKNNDVSKIFLYLYAYLIDVDSFIYQNSEYFDEYQLEHVFPRNWKKWESKQYNTNDVKDYINDIKDHYLYFKFNPNWLNEDSIIDFELKQPVKQANNRLKYNQQENSLIEWIGNKMVLHYKDNISESNKEFDLKQENLNSTNYLTIPNYNSDIYASLNHVDIKNCNDWDYKTIIRRSFDILDKIFKEIYFSRNNWDQVG